MDKKQFRSRMTIMIRSEIVSALKDMPEAERPININNPGDDPNFHSLVKDIKYDMEVHLMNLVDHYLSEGF